MQAPTAGVQALDISDGNTAPSSARLDRPLVGSAALETNGRKRQKRSHLTTVKPSAQQQQPTQVYNAAMLETQPLVDGTGQWDHLLARWTQTDQTIVDLNNLAADDDEYHEEEEQDGSGEAAEDDSGELSDGANGVEHTRRSKLNRDEIANIINERIEHFTAAWTLNRGVLKADEINYDPEAMWEEAEASNGRQLLTKTYETNIAYYTQRLDKLCDEIVKVPGRSADAIRHQCRNLEVTVNEIELAKWLLSIYQLAPVDNGIEEEQRPEVYMGHRTQSSAQVIDLGSPPESSQSGEVELVDSSPPPAVSEQNPSATRRVHSPDSVITDTTEHTADIPIATIVRPQAHFSDQPAHASISTVRRWKWAELVTGRDRKRIVTKALQEMGRKDREMIRDRLRTVGTPDMIREVLACIRMLAKNETKMPGVLSRDMPKIITFTRLFLCWWLCDNYVRVEPSKWHLEALERCLDEGSPDLGTFCDYLCKVMATTFSPFALEYPEQPSQAEIIEISDDDEPPPQPSATSNKRTSEIQHSNTIILD
jgi:hypothetical protein